MSGPSQMKLGRRAIKTDSRTLRMSKYMTPVLPAPPASVDWSKKAAVLGMMLNDKLGDCTIAGCGHAIQVWSANSYQQITLPDTAILSAYEKWDGYNPADPSTDQGGICLDVLNNWRQQGLASHSLLGFASADYTNTIEIQQSISLFGGVYCGMNFPNAAFNQQVWDVVADDGGIAGGHCVYVPAYNATGPKAISWGTVYQMTWAFWNKYFDESYSLLGFDWIGAKGSPDGFNLAQLQQDLAAIR